MDSNRYARLHELFVEAQSRAAASRAELVARLRAEDRELADELESLLAAEHEAETSHEAAAAGEHALLCEDAISDARQRLESIDSGAPALGLMPERIAGFRILRQLGEGGMGVVYEAEQETPRRRVALKIMRPVFGSPERTRRFRAEAEVLARLQHPGIAQIFEFGWYAQGGGAQPYLAMELIDGADLLTHCERAGLDARRRIELVARVADAVHHAHERGVVHRDLKPDNVLVRADGRPVVLDFGVARAMTGSDIDSLATRTGQILGTLAYMAPEQLSGEPERTTALADVFALGALTYQLLCGRTPHVIAGLPITRAIELISNSDPEPLGRFAPELRGDVETIVAKALEREPERRYESAAAFAADLRRWLEDRAIEARPPSRIDRAVKFTRRNRVLVLGSVATVLASLIGLVVSLVYARRAEDQARQAHESARRAQAGVLQITQALLESGEVWRAASTLRQLHGSSSGWEHDLVARVLPAVLPDEWTRFNATWVDERHLAFNASDGDGASVIDLESWREVRRFLRGRSLVLQELALANEWWSGELDAVFWVDPVSGAELARCEAPKTRERDGPLRSSRDSRGIVRQFCYDGDAAAWIVSIEGREVARIHERSPKDGVQLIPAPDGRRALAIDGRRGELRIFDTDTGAVLGALTGLRESGCSRASFTPDGGEVLTYDAQSHPVFIDVESAAIVRRHESIRVDDCEGGVLSPDGERFAHFARGRVEVWDLGADRLAFSSPLGVNTGAGGRVGFSPSGRQLFAAVQGQWSCVLSLADALPDATLLATDADPRLTSHRGHANYVYELALSPDDRLVASSSVVEPHVRLWDAATGETVATLEKPTAASSYRDSWSTLMAFSADGRWLLATASEGTGAPRLLAWDLLTGRSEAETLTGELASSAPRHAAWIDRLLSRLGASSAARLGRTAVLADGGIALAVQHREFRVPDGVRWRTFSDFDDENALALSPDGARVAVAAERSVRIHARTDSTRPPPELARFPGMAYCVAWSPDGRLIAAGDADGRIQLIDAETSTQLYSFRAHDDYVFALAWTSDSKRLVSASGDSKARVWDPRASSARAADLESYRTAHAALRSLDEAELERRFTQARTAAERGAIVRAALDRRAETAGK